MSLKDEREYEKFKSNLKYERYGTEDNPGPYWRTSFPWNIDKNLLINNKFTVLGFMNATKRKLCIDPAWEDIYDRQLKDLIDRKSAREVRDTKLRDCIAKDGKTY